MASVQSASYGGRYLKLTVVEQTLTDQDKADNVSRVKWTFESIGGSSDLYSIFNWGVVVGGTTVYPIQTTQWYGSGSASNPVAVFPAAKGSRSGTIRVKHRDDGTAANVSFTLSGKVYNSGTETHSGSISLTNIPRYATINTFTSVPVDETSIKIDWSTQNTIDKFEYSLNNGTSWTEKLTTDTSFVVNGLTPNTDYNVKIRIRRTDSGLTTTSDTIVTKTYDYPKANAIYDFVIGSTTSKAKVDLYNPLHRNVNVTLYKYVNNQISSSLGSYTGTGEGIIQDPFNTTSAINAQYDSLPGPAISSKFIARVIYSTSTKDSGQANYQIKNDGSEVPIFDNSKWGYTSNLTSLTGNNQKIINGYSEITFSVNTQATPYRGATISKYVYNWGEQSVNSTDTNKITGGTGNVLKVTAVDSRSQNTITSKTVDSSNYIDYSPPVIEYDTSNTHRVSGILAETHLNLNGSLSVSNFGNYQNAISTAQYRVYDYSNETWSNWFNINTSSFTYSNERFSLTDYLIHENGSSGGFTVGKRYAIQVKLKDGDNLLGEIISNNLTITDGKIARDVYQDSLTGEYHQGINGLAHEDYTNIIYGNEKVQGSITATGSLICDSVTSNSFTFSGNVSAHGNMIIDGSITATGIVKAMYKFRLGDGTTNIDLFWVEEV